MATRTSGNEVELVHIVAFVVFFPASAIYLAARALIRRQKAITQQS